MAIPTPENQSLAPCPFCGSTDKDMVADRHTVAVALHSWLPVYLVQCESCGCTGPVCSTPEEAVTYWNGAKPVPVEYQFSSL